MNKGHKETISIRFVSTAFMVLAIAIFKPFGLEMWQCQSFIHLLCIFSLGLFSCFLTEAILRFVVRMPRSYDHGVGYIIAFLSFAIGLYWRFKFRSRYLAMELEETRLLNEQLRNISSKSETDISGEKPCPQEITLTGTTNESVMLQISHLLYIEAVGNYVKICHLREGEVRTDMLRATSKQMEDDLKDYPMIVRCHRAFLVNLGQVEQIVSNSRSMQLKMKHCHEAIPVSRSNMSQIKETIRGI